MSEENKWEIEKDDRKITQETFTNKCESIFEAVMVIGNRARQIEKNNREEFEEKKREILDELREREIIEPTEDTEDYLPKFEKPVRTAMTELLNDELEVDYEDVTKID